MEENAVTKEESQATREIKKGCIYIEMVKENEKTIELEVPRKIRMSIFKAIYELNSGIPAFDITPKDWKGLIFMSLSFISMVSSFASGFPAGLIPFIPLLIFNLYITKNYYRHYIRRKLGQGYEIKDQEIMKTVEEVNAIPEDDTTRKMKLGLYTLILILPIIFFFVSINYTPNEKYIDRVKYAYLGGFGEEDMIVDVLDYVSEYTTEWEVVKLDDSRWDPKSYKLVEASWYAGSGKVVMKFLIGKGKYEKSFTLEEVTIANEPVNIDIAIDSIMQAYIEN